VLGSGHPAHMVAGFHRLAAAPWTILLFAPGAKVLAPIVRFRNYFFLSVLAGLALIILVIWLATGPVVASVTEVAEAAGRVARGDYGPPLKPRTADEAGRLVESFNAMVEGLRERDFIRDTFGRYVDPRVVRDLVGRPGATALGGRKRPVAIMMTDIRGFTALCESLDPETTINVVNQYLSRLIEVIQLYRGIIVDFLGDSILVMFDPVDGPLAPAVRDAVCCALEMQRRAADLNARDKAQGLPEILTGIGVHAGEVVVGNIGSEARTKYGLIGAPVNFTHRLQAEAQGGQIVVSDAVRESLAADLVVAQTFTARLKGIPEPVNLHVVADLSDCRPPGDEGGED
jgi:adenylate cyclase